MKKAILLFAIIASVSMSAQTVNKEKVESNIMEVWAFKKPFSNSESYFADYGQKKFRPHYYDHKTQSISDNDGNKFKKGDWVGLYSYLQSEGWEKTGERPATIGDLEGRVITFEHSQEE